MNCLRCGRAAQSSFCDECLKTVSRPLEPSVYLNTQISLNAKRAPRPTAPSPTQSAASDHKSSRGHKGLIAAVVVLSILCVVFAALWLWPMLQTLLPWFFA